MVCSVGLLLDQTLFERLPKGVAVLPNHDRNVVTAGGYCVVTIGLSWGKLLRHDAFKTVSCEYC